MSADTRHHTVPLIDLAPLLAGGRAERLAVARAIGRACEDIGFFTIVTPPPCLVKSVDPETRLFRFSCPPAATLIVVETPLRLTSAATVLLPDAALMSMPAVPRTMTGKKLEAPVKRILLGARADEVASADALLDPTAIEAFVAYAAARA